MLRTTRGVMSSTISDFTRLSFVDPKSRDSTGRSPRPGMREDDRRSSSLMRPARICVSPSRSCSTVDVLRVPIWYATVAPLFTDFSATMLLTSSPTFIETSSDR